MFFKLTIITGNIFKFIYFVLPNFYPLVNPFLLKAIRLRSISISVTLTITVCPTFMMEEGSVINLSLSCEMCTNPS